MAIRMDKYHRLVSAGIVPQLYWCGGAIYKSAAFDNAVFTSFAYSSEENGNIETVLAPALEWNVQTFERIDAPDFTQILFPPEYLYKTCWTLYHRKNAKLLRYFAELFNASAEWCLKKVYLLVKSRSGTDTGFWGEDAEAVVTLGEQEYRLPAVGLSVIDIATRLAELLNAEPSMDASAVPDQNQITIDLGARERDFNVSLRVDNPEENESLTFNPAYTTDIENPGRSYGFANRLYRTTDGKDLMRCVLIGATRELVGNEAIPTLDDDDGTPDLIAVMWDTQRKSGEYYTTKVRPLLNAPNLNDQVYSPYRLYGTVEATVYNLNINFTAELNLSVYTPEPIQMTISNPPALPVFFAWSQVENLSDWVHEYVSTIRDVLYGICGYIFRYQPLENYLENDIDINEVPVGLDSVTGAIINYRIYLNESGQLILESNSSPGTKERNFTATTVNGLLLNGDSSSSISIQVPPPPTEWDRGDFFWITREKYKLYTTDLSDSTQDPYLGTYWTISEVMETFSYKPSKAFPQAGYDESEVKQETIPNFKYELKYNGQTIHTGIGLHVPPVRPPFIGYDQDPIGELGYYTAPYGYMLPVPVRSDKHGLSCNFRQYTGPIDLPYRVGDFPIGHGLMTLIDINIPDSLCYVYYAYGFLMCQDSLGEATKHITEARSTLKELDGILLGTNGIIWSHTHTVETVTDNITTYKKDIDDGVYFMLTPQHKALYDELITLKQNSDNFTTTVSPLIAQHDQLYNQILASDDEETIKQREAARQEVLDQLQQAFDDYLKLHYTVLVNNFASTQLIEELEPGEFFIAPAYG